MRKIQLIIILGFLDSWGKEQKNGWAILWKRGAAAEECMGVSLEKTGSIEFIQHWVTKILDRTLGFKGTDG